MEQVVHQNAQNAKAGISKGIQKTGADSGCAEGHAEDRRLCRRSYKA
jgi:hypothetical protein